MVHHITTTTFNFESIHNTIKELEDINLLLLNMIHYREKINNCLDSTITFNELSELVDHVVNLLHPLHEFQVKHLYTKNVLNESITFQDDKGKNQ